MPLDRIAHALSVGDLDAIEDEIANGVDVNAIWPPRDAAGDGEPLIFHAIHSHNAPGAVDLLLRAGADPHLRSRRGSTVLISLAGSATQQLENITLIRQIVEAGADINATDADGYTALDRAIAITHSLYQLPRDHRNEDSPDLLVSRYAIDLLVANGAVVRKHESQLKLRQIRAMAAKEQTIGPGGHGRS